MRNAKGACVTLRQTREPLPVDHRMPVISRFLGIVIRMYFEDHAPPHFHAFYGDAEAVVRIEPLALLTGRLPPCALARVVEWASALDALYPYGYIIAWASSFAPRSSMSG